MATYSADGQELTTPTEYATEGSLLLFITRFSNVFVIDHTLVCLMSSIGVEIGLRFSRNAFLMNPLGFFTVDGTCCIINNISKVRFIPTIDRIDNISSVGKVRITA